MSVKAEIVDGRGSGQLAGVTALGELLVAGFGNLTNKSSFQSMTTTGAFNFYVPIAGQQFIITSIALDGPSNATVSIYEAANQFTSTIDKLLVKTNFRAAGQIAIPFPFGGFIPVSEGEYINAFTDAATVNLLIIGYYHSIQTNVI